MKNLARALINQAAFVELSPDSVIDPDAAVDAQEQLAFDLEELTIEEIRALRSVLAEMISEAAEENKTPGEITRLEFLKHFLENFGLEESAS